MKLINTFNIDNLLLVTLILLLTVQLFTDMNLIIFFSCVCITIVNKKNRLLKAILIFLVYGIKSVEIVKMRQKADDIRDEEQVDDYKRIGVRDNEHLGQEVNKQANEEVDKLGNKQYQTCDEQNQSNFDLNEEAYILSRSTETDLTGDLSSETLSNNNPFLKTFYINNPNKKKRKPVKIDGAYLPTTITINVRSKHLAKGNIIVNGAEISTFENQYIQFVG